jgi:hypothetical protein
MPLSASVLRRWRYVPSCLFKVLGLEDHIFRRPVRRLSANSSPLVLP